MIQLQIFYKIVVEKLVGIRREEGKRSELLSIYSALGKILDTAHTLFYLIVFLQLPSELCIPFSDKTKAQMSLFFVHYYIISGQACN